ncbi:hypothetical protein [Streptomyces luteireticuli]|uniref:hypothetical protein n=1 Tax=Streptomyces luteireticuli TaxID=173858 RepID=UPI003556A86F
MTDAAHRATAADRRRAAPPTAAVGTSHSRRRTLRQLPPATCPRTASARCSSTAVTRPSRLLARRPDLLARGYRLPRCSSTGQRRQRLRGLLADAGNLCPRPTAPNSCV